MQVASSLGSPTFESAGRQLLAGHPVSFPKTRNMELLRGSTQAVLGLRLSIHGVIDCRVQAQHSPHDSLHASSESNSPGPANRKKVETYLLDTLDILLPSSTSRLQLSRGYLRIVPQLREQLYLISHG